MDCGTAEGRSSKVSGGGESQQDDVVAQVEGLFTEVVSSQSYGLPQFWACGKRGRLKRDCWRPRRSKSKNVQSQTRPQPHLN